MFSSLCSLYWNVMWCSSSYTYSYTRTRSLRTWIDSKWAESFVTQFDISKNKNQWFKFVYVLFSYICCCFMRNKNHMDRNCNVATLIQYMTTYNVHYTILNVINGTFHQFWIRFSYLFRVKPQYFQSHSAINTIPKKNSQSNKNQMCMRTIFFFHKKKIKIIQLC